MPPKLLWLAAVGACLASAGAAGALAAFAPDHDAPIAPGDKVRLHLTAYRPDGTVAYTTDPDVARAAADPALDPDLEGPTYQPRRVVVPQERADVAGPNATRFRPQSLLAGARVGDVLATPFLVDPFGVPRTYEIPRALGPVPLEFTLDLSKLYDDEHRNRSVALFGPREAFAQGARVPYDYLEATVLDVDGDDARLRLDAGDGARILSRPLGFDVELRPAGEGQVTVHPLLEPGQVFGTRGCDLPLEDLPPGRFRVLRVEDDRAVVESAPIYVEAMQNATLRFELRILEVEPPRPLEATRLWLATRLPFLNDDNDTEETP